MTVLLTLFVACAAPRPVEDLADRWWYAEGAALYLYLETTEPAEPGGIVWLRGNYPVGDPALSLASGTLAWGSWRFEDPDVYVIDVAGATYRGHAGEVDEFGCVEVSWLWWADTACPADPLTVDAYVRGAR